MSKFLFVSDLHVHDSNYDKMISWLKEMVSKHKPDFIISGGDNGDLYVDDLTNLGVDFYSVYGNHDTIEWVKDNSKYWLSDGLHILKYGGVEWKILAWNGIIGFSNKWYHKSLDEIVKFGFSWRDTRPDVLVMHDVPFTDGRLFRKRIQPYHGAVTFMIENIKPRVVCSGHMHNGVIINKTVFDSTVFVNVESGNGNYMAVLVEKECDGCDIKVNVVN